MKHKILALILCVFALFAAPRPAEAQTAVALLRWVDIRGYNWVGAWSAAARWNRLLDRFIFLPGDGIGTELIPHAGPFESYRVCCFNCSPQGVHGCNDLNLDIHYNDLPGGQYEADVLVHEFGHNFVRYGNDAEHHTGRGVMARKTAQPTSCLTMDDYIWACEWIINNLPAGNYCGVPHPEC